MRIMKVNKLLVIKFLTMVNLILIESQDMDLKGNNVNKQPSQSTCTYLSMDLKYLKETVYHNSCYKTLPMQICRRIIDLNINKKEGEDVELGLEAENSKILDMPTYQI